MVYLRKINISDFDYLKYIENSDKFNQFSFNKTKYSDSELKNFLFESLLPVSKTKQIRFVICKEFNDNRLGFVDLFNIDFCKSTAGVSIIIDDSSNRYRGYGRLTLKKLIEYNNKVLGINKFHCLIRKKNKASIKCFESVGFFKSCNRRKNNFFSYNFLMKSLCI